MSGKFIINPLTGARLQHGSKTHIKLINDNVLNRDTLDINKISIINDSRSVRSKAILEFTKTNTHFTNINQIANELSVDPLEIISYMRNEFEMMRIIIHNKTVRVIIDGHEPFIDRVIQDYINNNLKNERWNE